MTKKNKPHDVFKQIDMRDGDRNQCWPWVKSLDKGRPYFRVGGRKRLAYALTYELMFGYEFSSKEVARHKCDNPMCCNPYHIEPGTHEDNMRDMRERDRHGLSAHAIAHVRRLIEESRPDKEIAEIVGIARETVRDIRLGKRRNKE